MVAYIFSAMHSSLPGSTDQYIEPAQHGVQDVLNISTEVHVFHRAGQTDRAVYWTVPHTSGKELWLEPWSDGRSDRTGACLSRPTSQAKADGQPRINLGRANSKSTRDVADPKRRLLQFDVQEFCDNFEKGMMKVLKDISKNQKKSTSTRAPVAEPSLFISKKSKGKSETHVEELKDFSDSLPTFDEYDEEPIESLMTCENKCDLPSLEPEFVTDIEHAIVELPILQPEHPSCLVLSPQVFEEEPLGLPHQGPRLDTRISFDEDQDPIFDEEDEPGPVFDEGATNITSIAMESHLCFDPGTTHAPLSFELQEHCEQSDFLNSQPDMFVNISSLDVIRFGLEKLDLLCSETDKTWHFLRSILHNCVDLSLDDIVEMHVLKMNTIVAYLDKILSEREVQLLRNESIDRAQQPEI
ncbi:hypothetical protein YC2023_082636 [Brassica napus]